MRLRELRRDAESIMYCESWAKIPWGLLWAGWALAVAVGTICGESDLSRFLWAFVPVFVLWTSYALAFHTFAREFRLYAREKKIAVCKRWLGGQIREQILVATDVTQVVLAVKFRRPHSYKLLYLNLSDGAVLEIDRGEEMAQMDRLAAEVATALDHPLQELKTDLFGARLSLERNSPALAHYSDVRNYERRRSDLMLVATSSVFLGIGAVGLAGFFYASRHTAVPVREALFTLVFLAMFPICGAAGLATGILSLRSLRLRELEIHNVKFVALRYWGMFSCAWEEIWWATEIAAIVKVIKPHGREEECRQVWLRREDGRWLLLDEDRADWFGTDSGGDLHSRWRETSDSLGKLARDLHLRLEIPVERCHRRFSLSKFQPPRGYLDERAEQSGNNGTAGPSNHPS
jgi:hypothetical protein